MKAKIKYSHNEYGNQMAIL